MPLSEFELIRQFFAHQGPVRADVSLGIGDDCALLKVPAGKELAVTIDTLVEGVHFHAGTDPEALGYKALAVNLSDLAAMGAEPAWATLALTLPVPDESWLTGFSRGFAALATKYQVQLVGGDTTRGPRTISVQLHGFVEPGRALRRDGARPGDLIYVTGTLGDAGLALLAHSRSGGVIADQYLSFLKERLERPQPRIAEGLALGGLASAAIDISDGLISDLGHICEASEVGAHLSLERLPCSPAVQAYLAQSKDWGLALAAGDDYELCVTVPPERQAEVERLAAGFACGLTRIGVIEVQAGVRCIGPGGRELASLPHGWDHFRSDD